MTGVQTCALPISNGAAALSACVRRGGKSIGRTKLADYGGWEASKRREATRASLLAARYEDGAARALGGWRIRDLALSQYAKAAGPTRKRKAQS